LSAKAKMLNQIAPAGGEPVAAARRRSFAGNAGRLLLKLLPGLALLVFWQWASGRLI
jgi:NitT/TauT family transport system permease protein